MNGPGEKSFKQLWRELSKAGWKARKPTGIATDHRYVKPDIKGRLEDFKRGRDFFVGEVELIAFARLAGILQLPVTPTLSSTGVRTLPSTDTTAAVLAESVQPSLTTNPIVTSPNCATTEQVSAVVEDALEDSEQPVLPGTEASGCSEQVDVSPTSTPQNTELPTVPDTATLDDTEQANASPTATLLDREQLDTPVRCTSGCMEARMHIDEEETKSEGDVHDTVSDMPGLDIFDSENFMEGMRSEKLFGPVIVDDVNVVNECDGSDSESDADEEDVMADNEGVLSS